MLHFTGKSIYFHTIPAVKPTLRVIKSKCRHIFSMILKQDKKLNLSLCLIINHAMKTNGEAEIPVDVFLASSVDGDE
jgi:hypothetical protein